MIEIKGTVCLKHPETTPKPPPAPGLWKNYLPWNQPLVLKRLGPAGGNRYVVTYLQVSR